MDLKNIGGATRSALDDRLLHPVELAVMATGDCEGLGIRE
jgi:hypothetical protein